MDDLYDVIVVGGGPAGLTAAIYLARARYRVLVVEKDRFGGQISITEEVVNYPGISRISGRDLTQTMMKQGKAFGGDYLQAEVTGFDLSCEIKTVKTTVGDYRCLGLLIATGAHPRNAGFQGEEEFKGRGVAYCATCDGEFFAGKEVFVIGGGYAAAEESVFLTRFAKHVTILMRKGDFSCAESVSEPAKNHPKITILPYTVMEEVRGDHGLTYVRYRNTQTEKVQEYKVGDTFGVFVFAGYAPATELLRGIVELNEQGYILTDNSQQTNVIGVFAAGDVCVKPLRQVVTATADGALAATELEKYVESMRQKLDIRPIAPMGKNPESESTSYGEVSELFDEKTVEELGVLFSKMERPLLLKLYLDHRTVSKELEAFIRSLAGLTDKLSVTVAEDAGEESELPCVRVCLEDGTPTGLAFHGVPGGHEFTSFVLGLYNVAGPGQMILKEVKERIKNIREPVDLKIFVTLSCTLCPDLVKVAQRIAAENPKVTADVYDIRHFEELKTKHQIMSVPCILLNNKDLLFGKKSVEQLLDAIEKSK